MKFHLRIETPAFLQAVRCLYPGRLRKDGRLGAVDIGFRAGWVIFSTAGSKSSCFAFDAFWPGYATVDKAVILSFKKVQPTSETVQICYENGRLKIERLSIPALWAETPEYITEMATEARLHEGPEDTYAEIRNCVSRSKCKNLWSELDLSPDSMIRSCSQCGNRVVLCVTAKELQKAIALDKTVAISISRLKRHRFT
jgi:hypothetical protein